MKLVSHTWSSKDWTLGDAKIECNCGNIFSIGKLVIQDLIECPKCGKREKYVSCSYVSYWLVPKFEETTTNDRCRALK